LLDIHWSYALWVATYVSFCTWAILNIVTGIFVNAAILSAQEDQDVAINDAMEQQSSYAQSLLRVFMEADADKDGMLDSEEFDMHLEDRRVRAYLHHLGLQVDEAKGLYKLLDIGNTGKVDRKEFVLGCMRLKGPAKNVDVATLLYENKRMMELWTHFMVYVEDQFAVLTTAEPVAEWQVPAPVPGKVVEASIPLRIEPSVASIGEELMTTI
jgi:Ca2+-binding EF-hand superfamily protein